MKIRRNLEEEGTFWADREVDDKADHFRPCGSCEDKIGDLDLEDKVWNEFDPCQRCESLLEIRSAVAEIHGVRPLILDREPETVLYEAAYPPLPEFDTGDPYYSWLDEEDEFFDPFPRRIP